MSAHTNIDHASSWSQPSPVFPASTPLWLRRVAIALLLAAAAVVVGVLAWQGITAQGNPDPTAANLSPTAIAVNAGIIVFREGLEAILVLTALTAGLMRTGQRQWKPVSLGAGLSFLATIVTWFVVVGIIANVSAPELDIQAATGLLAVIVLLIIMNWFFHRLYWTGWISHHGKRQRSIMQDEGSSRATIYRGLMLVGFTAMYREGFEVVLFLQNLRLQAGSKVILAGVLIGLGLTAIVGLLTLVAHYKLPYKKMLIFTGVMIGVVLTVMVGETVQEMQQAHWIPTTSLGWHWPGWLNLWLAVYPSVESLASQIITVFYVLGIYFLARHLRKSRPHPAAS